LPRRKQTPRRKQCRRTTFRRRRSEPSASPLNQCRLHLSALTAVLFRKLSTSVEEEASNKALLTDLTERERSAADDVAEKKSTLANERGEREREIAAGEAASLKLKVELDDLAQSNASKMVRLRRVLL
jgi:hypothetical protein